MAKNSSLAALNAYDIQGNKPSTMESVFRESRTRLANGLNKSVDIT